MKTKKTICPPTQKRCETCQHWKNQQALLNYSDENGVCVNDEFRFNTTDGRMLGVLDINNQKDIGIVWGNASHDIETLGVMPRKVYQSQYSLQTNEKFGCIFHEEK